MRVCLLSCHRPLTPALVHTLFQAVFRVVTEGVGSLGLGFPNAKTNHSPRSSPNCEAWRVHVPERRRRGERERTADREKADFERFANLTSIGSSFNVEVANAEENC
jgi:hypothetical protein